MEFQHAATAFVVILMFLEVPAMYVKDGPIHRSRGLELAPMRDHEVTKRLCGNELMAVLEMVCRVHGHTTKNKNNKRKKSIPDELEWGLMDEPSAFPFRSRLSRTLIPLRVRRDESGIADECCNKACTTEEMLGYCERSAEDEDGGDIFL